MKRKLFAVVFTLMLFFQSSAYAAGWTDGKVVTNTYQLGLAVEEAFNNASDEDLYTDLNIVVTENVKNFLEKNPQRTGYNKVFKLPNSPTLNNKVTVDVWGIEPNGDYYNCYLFVRFFNNKSEFKDIMQLEHFFATETKGLTDLQKAQYLNSFLAKKLSYDYSYTCYDAMSAVKTNVATCSGYSDLFQVLGESAGLRVGRIASNKMDHQWNYVRIGNKTYYIDSTHNDRGSYATGQYFSTKPIHQKKAPDQYVFSAH